MEKVVEQSGRQVMRVQPCVSGSGLQGPAIGDLVSQRAVAIYWRCELAQRAKELNHVCVRPCHSRA
jgi:hypothetical protein